MPKHQLHWTALPRAATASHVEIDVFVSPRLGIDGGKAEYTLAEFPEMLTWTDRVAAGEVTFAVAFDGTPPTDADVVPLDSLDPGLWAHLFPPTTPVRPWSYRDYSTRPIRSYPVRWVTAYLRDVYRQVGRGSPTALPSLEQLDRVRLDLGRLIDTRVDEERDNARPDTAAAVPVEPLGCLAALIAPWYRLLRRLWRLLTRWLLGHAAGHGPAHPPPATPADEQVRWFYRPPAPRSDNPLEEVEQKLAEHGVVPPVQPLSTDLSTALSSYPVAGAFAQILRFYERPESAPTPQPHPDIDKVMPPPAEPKWDFHRRLGALGDYPRLMQRLALVVRLSVQRPATRVQEVQVIPSWNGQVRPQIDITPHTRCTLDGDRFFATPLPGSDLVDGMLNLNGAGDRLTSTTGGYDLVQVDTDGVATKTAIAAASFERRLQLRERGLWGLGLAEPESLPATQSAGIAVVRVDRAFHLKGRLKRAREHWEAQGSKTLYADDVVRGYHVWVQSVSSGVWRSLCHRQGIYRLVDDDGKHLRTLAIQDDDGYVKRSGATSKDATSDLYVHEAVVRWTGWSLVAPRPGKIISSVEGERHDTRTNVDVPTQDEVAAAHVSKAASGFRIETRFRPTDRSLPRLRFGNHYRLAMTWVDLAGLPPKALANGPEGPAGTALVSDEIVFRRFEPLGFPAVLPRAPFSPGGSLERLVLRSDHDRDVSTWFADAGMQFPEVRPEAGWLIHDERRLFPPKTSQHMAELHGRFDDAIGPGGDRTKGYERAVREKGTFAAPAVPSFGAPAVVGETVINADEHSVLVAPYLPDPIAAGVALRGVPNLTVAGGVSGDPLPVHTVPGTEDVMLHVPFTGTWPDLESFRLRLSDAGPDAPPNWDARKRVLTINVEKAEDVEVVYGCYLTSADLDLMGAWDWLDGGEASGNLREQAELGAHWLITSWRTLRLTHAVQRPLADPQLINPKASRDALETVAKISGDFTVDGASTGRVDLEAAWREPVDDPATPRWVLTSHKTAVSHWTPESSNGPLPETRHEFGDSRHRKVRYRLRATSGFREYFPTGLELTRAGTEDEVSVPGSAPPDPPKPAYLVPGFGWRDESAGSADVPLAVGETRRRTRVGGGVRVFLERPWFSSGEGERLAVVLPGPDPLPPTMISQVGIDPTVGEVARPATVELVPSMFPGAKTESSVRLSERSERAAIASFQPSYDEQRRLWVCDITVDMTKLPWGEWPFVRLALARHQPDAIEGAHLSKVVLAEWTQLAPDRSLVVERSAADRVSVTLRGRGRVAPTANRVLFGFERASSASPDPLDWLPADGSDASLPTVQTWETATAPVRDGEDQVWRAINLAVPDPQGGALRLTIRELEQRHGEGEVAAGVFRFVYADAVRL